MKNLQKRRKKQYLLHSKPILFLFGILIVFFIWTIVGLVDKAIETAKNTRIAKEKVEELQKQKSQLTEELEKLNTQKGVEENIREKFSWAKEGEEMIIVVDDQNEIGNEAGKHQGGFLNFLKNLFK